MDRIPETTLRSPLERQSALKEILNTGIAEVRLAKTLPPSLKRETDHILEGLLVLPWSRSSSENRNQIPFAGSRTKPVEPTTIQYIEDDGSITRMRVVVKKSMSDLASIIELVNLEKIIRDTKIRSLLPLAAVTFLKDPAYGHLSSSWVITMLETGVMPLERIDYKNMPATQLKALLNELAVFTAELGNSGVSHRDYHARNIGIDISQRGGSARMESQIILFDPENSVIVDREIHNRMLNVKNSDIGVQAGIEFYKIGRNYVNDATDLVIDLKKVLSPELIDGEFIKPYVASRLPMLDSLSPEDKLRYISQGICL